MPIIPTSVNGVEVTFPSTANLDVVQSAVDALRHVIRPYAYGKIRGTSDFGVRANHDSLEEPDRFVVTSIYISSASDSTHASTSRHYMHKAIDISRINGMRFSEYYPTNLAIQALVKKYQLNFEQFAGRRENFGPYLLLKLGRALNDRTEEARRRLAEQHRTHIHFSVN